MLLDTIKRAMPTIKYYALPFNISLIFTIIASLLIAYMKSYYILILAIPMLALGFKSFVNLLRLITLIKLSNNYLKKVVKQGSVRVKCGQPGTHKTHLCTYEIVALAKANWRDLKNEYKLLKPLAKEWYKNGDDKYYHFQEVKKAYKFFKENEKDFVPCLYSNIHLYANNKQCYTLNYEHSSQEENLPYKSIGYYDEGGYTFLIETSKEKPFEVADFYRFIRHYIEGTILISEQDCKNIPNYIRKIVSINQELTDCKKLFDPKYLKLKLKIKTFLYNKKFDLRKPKDKMKLSRQAKQILKLNKQIQDIGFFKITSRTVGCLETKTDSKSKSSRLNVYITAKSTCTYDTRSFSEMYKAKDKEPITSRFNSLKINEQEFEKNFKQRQAVLQKREKEK